MLGVTRPDRFSSQILSGGDDPPVRHARCPIDADNVVHLGPHRCGGYYQSGQCTSRGYSAQEPRSENEVT